MGCQDDPHRAMNSTERKLIDSVVIQHQKIWRVRYDSICAVQRDSMVHHYFDSILHKEIASMKKLKR